VCLSYVSSAVFSLLISLCFKVQVSQPRKSDDIAEVSSYTFNQGSKNCNYELTLEDVLVTAKSCYSSVEVMEDEDLMLFYV
jgi:hypothetical protein